MHCKGRGNRQQHVLRILSSQMGRTRKTPDQTKASKPYVVEHEDEDADEFITELFSYLDVAKGELLKLAEEWERVNVNAINDLHRVKNR